MGRKMEKAEIGERWDNGMRRKGGLGEEGVVWGSSGGMGGEAEEEGWQWWWYRGWRDGGRRSGVGVAAGE